MRTLPLSNHSTVAIAELRKPTLRIGSTHTDVSELQNLLGHYVTNPKLSGGIFNALTDYAVRLFQYRMFLVEDGIVGPQTWRALYTGAPINMPVLSPQIQHPAVKLLEQALSVAGYGPPTGGDRMVSIVARKVSLFQADKGLVADAIVGPRTWHALSKTRLEDPSATITSIILDRDHKLHNHGITDLAVEPFVPSRGFNIRRIATASRDTTVRLWQSNGEPTAPVYQGDRGSVSSVTFHPTQPQLISGTFGGTVRISDYMANTLTVFPTRGGSVIALAVDPLDRYIVTANADGAVRMFTPQGDFIRDLIQPRNSAANTTQSLAISAQGQLVTANNSLGANLWNNPLDPNGNNINISTSRSANAVAFNPNGYKFALSRGPLVQIYSNRAYPLASTRCPATVNAITFNSSGRYVAMGCQDHKVYILDLQANGGLGEIVFDLSAHTSPVSAVGFSHTPEFTFHSADQSGRLITWNISKGQPNIV